MFNLSLDVLKRKRVSSPKTTVVQWLDSPLTEIRCRVLIKYKQLIFSGFWYVSHCLINRALLFKAKSSAYWRSIEEKNLSQTVSLNLAARVFFFTSFNRKLASWKEKQKESSWSDILPQSKIESHCERLGHGLSLYVTNVLHVEMVGNFGGIVSVNRKSW